MDSISGGFTMPGNLSSALFKPIRFGSVTAKNRVVMAPTVTNFASPEDEVTDRHVGYYAERAKGGLGTIVVEASPVRSEVRISSRQIGCYDDRFVPGLAKVADAIKTRGALALLQLIHGGPKTLAAAGSRIESISNLAIRKGEFPYPLTAAELRRVCREFVSAASRACRAGFEGVELHAAHLYLLSASISPFTNTRIDEYGGSLANQARLTREIIESIKTELGGQWPVWVRMHAREELQPGLKLEEAQEIAKIFVQAGADAIHVSAYTLPINPKIARMVNIKVGSLPLRDTPPGPFLDYAKAIKQAVPVPVIAVGKLDDPSLAARAVVEGKCDMVALARQLICDPYWSEKVAEGRDGEIVHCNYCNTCHTAQQRGEEIRCSQNLNLCGKPIYKPDQKKKRR
jgi:2,4-dienoyl-CoA reductase-like NADH-dependent reductase (Old Yellow Enzyme family)